jgi:hypothetical protein
MRRRCRGLEGGAESNPDENLAARAGDFSNSFLGIPFKKSHNPRLRYRQGLTGVLNCATIVVVGGCRPGWKAARRREDASAVVKSTSTFAKAAADEIAGQGWRPLWSLTFCSCCGTARWDSEPYLNGGHRPRLQAGQTPKTIKSRPLAVRGGFCGWVSHRGTVSCKATEWGKSAASIPILWPSILRLRASLDIRSRPG